MLIIFSFGLPSDNVLILVFCLPLKPLEIREAHIKSSEYKVCVLGLWAAQEKEGKRLVMLADALESGR